MTVAAVRDYDERQPTMIADLIAAQNAMPGLQKSAINPHFKNKYVPLEELIEKVLPVLNAHGLALVQLPSVLDGHPALETRLLHRSGESLGSTMLLLCAKDDPQGQGSAITYARRYSLMSLLGLSADQDDDGERSHQGMVRQSPPAVQVAVQRRRTQERIAERDDVPPPQCPEHGTMRYVAPGTSKATGKPYGAFWGCTERTCTAGARGKGAFVDADGWYAQHQPSTPMDYDPDAVPAE